jgi:hypothetical protein
MVETIHAPSSAPLTLEGLHDLPAEAWSEARLVPNTALRLLRFGYPVNEYFQGFRDGGDPPIPEPRKSSTVVWRSGPTVWRMDLTDAMRKVLSALLDGESLAAALLKVEPRFCGGEEPNPEAQVTGWFREWVQGGLFAHVEVDRNRA